MQLDERLFEVHRPGVDADDVIARLRRELAAAERARDVGDTLGPAKVARELQKLGNALRKADNPAAIERLQAAVAAFEQLERRRAVFLTRLKLAEAQARFGEPRAALTLLDALAANIDEQTSMYSPFVTVHRAAALLAAGTRVEALACLEEVERSWREAGTDALADTIEQHRVRLKGRRDGA